MVPTIEEYTTLLDCESIKLERAYIKHIKSQPFKNALAKTLGYIDAAVVELFEQLPKRVNPAPTILAETFRSLNHCRRTGGGRFIGCVQLLQRAPWLFLGDVLFRCGDSDTMTLLGLWDAVGYAPLLALRQYEARQFVPITYGLARSEFGYHCDSYKKMIKKSVTVRTPGSWRNIDVDLMIIARSTPGFSGADLANLVNVDDVIATMHGAKDVIMADLEYEKDKIILGSERKSAVISEESQKLTAFHEAGHALVVIHTDGALPVHKATIVPRGMALGMVSQLPDVDQTSFSRKQMLARLDVALGGWVAEELIFGENEVTSGPCSDLEKTTKLSRSMVTKHIIEKEVKYLMERAYNNAKTILTTYSKEHHALANALLEHETLTGAQIKALLAQVNSQQRQQEQREEMIVSQNEPKSKPASSSSSPAASAAAAAAAAAAAVTTTSKAKGVAPVGS
ncbi:ATP-dependent zinc metalloprotease FTSH 4 [Hibiscus syriacus]|uniref:ATP-dependent zinc metalloprotease FTSH 4 n=1 Tax=Hibiscus syriacus TaxID=106335 RepID=A0A6A2XKP8_HIBSY|nr:ATP-dependent zinc metalloprotease FTSH 4 [Hibiscus syriacus]